MIEAASEEIDDMAIGRNSLRQCFVELRDRLGFITEQKCGIVVTFEARLKCFALSRSIS